MPDLGKTAYDGYWKQCGGRSLISNEWLPPWEKLSNEIRSAWAAAEKAVRDASPWISVGDRLPEEGEVTSVDTDEEIIEPWCNTIMEQPLALHEQQDLFNQMEKWLTANPVAKDKLLLRPEIENIYRLKATVVALHNEIAAGDTAIRQLEIGMELGMGRQHVDMEMPVHDRPSVPDEVAKPIRDENQRITDEWKGRHPQ